MRCILAPYRRGFVPSRILIADDHDGMRQMLKKSLEGHPGWAVLAEAKDGMEAVSLALELLPDVIILDPAMPQLDGLHATRNILSVLPDTPILLYTSHAWPTLLIEAVRAGVRQVVSKSAPVEHLIEAVEVALRGNGGDGSDDGRDGVKLAGSSSGSESAADTTASGQSSASRQPSASDQSSASRRRFRTSSSQE